MGGALWVAACGWRPGGGAGAAARGSSGIRGGIGGLGRESSAPECGIRPERGSAGESGRRRVSVGVMPAGGGAGRAGPGTEAERGGNGGAAGRAGTRAGRRGARAVAGRVVGCAAVRVVGCASAAGRGAVVGVVECAVGRTSRAPVHGTRPELDGVNVSRWERVRGPRCRGWGRMCSGADFARPGPGARNAPRTRRVNVSRWGARNAPESWWGRECAAGRTSRAPVHATRPELDGPTCHGGERGMPPNPAGPRCRGWGREMCSGADFARPGARNAPRT